MTRALTVWWNDAPVGVLRLDENGDLAFQYEAAWLADDRRTPISLSLPKQDGPFGRAQTRPFFAGLLPEEGTRQAVARILGVSRENDFGLLEGLGGDVAGALTLWPEGEPPPSEAVEAPPVALSEAELERILFELPRRPLLAGEGGVRLSLAGAQPKLPVVQVDGGLALPLWGQPTTHILKPAPRDYPTFPDNEAFCMRLAASLGLMVAEVSPLSAGAQRCLLVRRYDRVQDADGRLRRLHQEDFCQALGVTPEHKYASERGPDFRRSFDLLRRAVRPPAPAVLALLDAALFNLIIGNADAHGKNFSLLHTDDGLRLAPLYDLLCTAFYPEVHVNLAMRMGGRSRLEEFTRQTLTEFAAQVGMGAPWVRRRAGALADQARAAAPGVAETLGAEGSDPAVLKALVDLVTRRADVVRSLVAA